MHIYIPARSGAVWPSCTTCISSTKYKIEHKHDADKAVFLGKSGENEIGVRYWQEAQLRLRTFCDALTPGPPDPTAILDCMS